MFRSTVFNQNISAWNVSKVINMNGMFTQDNSARKTPATKPFLGDHPVNLNLSFEKCIYTTETNDILKTLRVGEGQFVTKLARPLHVTCQIAFLDKLWDT